MTFVSVQGMENILVETKPANVTCVIQHVLLFMLATSTIFFFHARGVFRHQSAQPEGG